MPASRVLILAVGVLALTTACSGSHIAPAGPPLLAATTLAEADAELRQLLTDTLAPEEHINGLRISGGVDLVPAQSFPHALGSQVKPATT